MKIVKKINEKINENALKKINEKSFPLFELEFL